MKRVRVIDLTQHLSGPFCTWTLAALGADIIKVEAYGTGEGSRDAAPVVNGRSLYFDSLNRGKRSISIDLKSPDGKAVLADLVRDADVLVENFRPGVRARLGCSDEELKAINADLIICSISGFGQSTSLSRRPAYDIVAQAMSGMMSINGAIGSSGTRVGVSLGDIAAGLFAAVGILARLYERDVDGRQAEGGVDISMVGCQLALLENAFARHLNNSEAPVPMGSRHPSMAPFESFATADGAIVVGLGTNADWPRFCAAIDAPELVSDPRFIDIPARLRNRDCLEKELVERLSRRSTDHWVATLEKASIAAGPVWSISEFARSDFAREIGAFEQVAGGSDNFFVRHPLGSPTASRQSPAIGEHSREILAEIGYGPNRIAGLIEDGVLYAS